MRAGGGHYRSGVWVWLAAVLTLPPAAMLADAIPADPACIDEADGKEGLCGRAAAARAIWSDLSSGPPIALEDQADTDITHCFLDIELNPTAKTVSGSNTLSVISRVDGLSVFTLDLRSNMNVSEVRVNGLPVSYTRPTHKIQIPLGSVYNRGQSFQVRVAYQGTPQKLGWQSFDISNHGNPARTIMCSLSQPWWAHTWWPCKENIARVDDKFTLDMWVTVPDWMVVAANGLLQGTDTLSGNRLRYRWRENYPIATYLVSVAATNYVRLSQSFTHPGGSMPVEFYFYPETAAADTAAVANIVPMLAALSAPPPLAFGLYPFIQEKYGIARFSWCCGMEHQTMTSQGSMDERTNIHELAHSWWGNNVTCATWHDIWLNEGFATFSEALWHERKPGGSYQAYIDHMVTRKPSYFADTVYVYDISDYSRVFSSNYTYRKAAWVVHMLRWVLGSDAFFHALAAYRGAFEGSAATTADFQAAMEGATGQNLDWFFNQWVYGGGGPYYRCGWQEALIAGQHYVRYYIHQYQRESMPAYPYFRMPVEIAVTTARGTTVHRVWNEHEKQWYLLPAEGPVSAVQFDRDLKILHANNQQVAYAPGPPRLVSVSPAIGAVIPRSTPVSRVTLLFSEAINFTPADFSVTGSSTGPAALTAAYDPGTWEVTLNFAQPLTPGQTFTVRVRDTVTSQAGGMNLDGELADPPVLPGGNGLPGGEAVYSFVLEGCPDPFADADRDVDVDMDDFGHWQRCVTGSGDPDRQFQSAACGCFDRDGDRDVDIIDLSAFLNCARGAGIPADPACD